MTESMSACMFRWLLPHTICRMSCRICSKTSKVSNVFVLVIFTAKFLLNVTGISQIMALNDPVNEKSMRDKSSEYGFYVTDTQRVFQAAVYNATHLLIVCTTSLYEPC